MGDGAAVLRPGLQSAVQVRDVGVAEGSPALGRPALSDRPMRSRAGSATRGRTPCSDRAGRGGPELQHAAWCLDRSGAPGLVGLADVDECHRVGLEFAGELIDYQVADLAPGLCHELLNRTGHDPLLSAASVAFNSGGLINWSANQRAGYRMRGLELDSTLVTERFQRKTGPVTDQRRCATG